MNKTENMATMLLTLTQSDEWLRLCDNDEGIREANDNLQLMIDKLAADNPDELTEQLWEAVCRICDACSAAAMLYKEEDYFSLTSYDEKLAFTEAGKRLMRRTKAEIISTVGQCRGILVAFWMCASSMII